MLTDRQRTMLESIARTGTYYADHTAERTYMSLVRRLYIGAAAGDESGRTAITPAGCEAIGIDPADAILVGEPLKYWVERRRFAVNHNGTEDWVDLPAGARREDDGRVTFDDLEAAQAFGELVARDALGFMVGQGHDLDEARRTLADDDDGVPVQLIDVATDDVILVVDPADLTPLAR